MSLTMIYGIKVDQELKDSDMEYMSAYLELEECLRFSKYIRKIDKQRFLLGRVLLKKENFRASESECISDSILIQ